MLSQKLFRKSSTYKMSKWIQGLLALIFALSLVGVQPVKPVQAAGTISLTTLSTLYTENFDSLANSGTSSSTPNGWTFYETGTSANNLYTASDGSTNNGDTFSFGTGDDTDRAFGSMYKTGLTPKIGAGFTNNTGTTITGLEINYTGEQWRYGGTSNSNDRMDFQFSLDATSLEDGTWSDVDSLDFSSVIISGTTGALNGNAPENRSVISSSILGLNIVNGATFWIQWVDFNISGYDDQLAVDDFSLTAIGPLNTTSAGTAAAISVGLDAIDISMPYSDDANADNTYSVDYKLSSASEWMNWVTDAGHTVSPYTTTITGLSPATSYDIRVTYNDPDGVTGVNPQIIEGVSTYFSLTVDSGSNGSVTLDPAGGSYAPGTEVTLTAVANSGYEFNSWSGDLTGDENPTTLEMDGDKTVIADFAIAPILVELQDGLNGYDGTRDTYIFNTSPSTVRGFEATIVQDYDSATVERRSLLSFDLSSIPAGATITSAELEFYVTAEGMGFNFYRMFVPWDEATVTYTSIGDRHYQADGIDAETSVDVNWSKDGFTGFTSVIIPVSTIQDWVDGTLPNYGWLGIATDNPGGDGQQLASRENGTQTRNPKLTIEYYAATGEPTIVITGTPLEAFTSQPGTPSEEQSYFISGSGLSDNIEITSPTDFKVSLTSGSDFVSALSLIPDVDGNVPLTTIYVRFNRGTEGSSNGDITHISTDATAQTIAVSGTATKVPTVVVFQDGLNGYEGTRDTYIYDVSPETARGTETTFVQDINTGDERRSLLLFDLSSIPENAIISSAELQFYVSAEGQGFNMYRMYQPWDEAITFTSNGGHFDADDIDAESTINANWPGDDGYTGYITVTVSPETIEDWIDGTLVNNGWLMIATDVDDGQQLRSREYTTQADRPKLTVEYVVNPNITVSGTLNEFHTLPGVASEPQTYTVEGANLYDDINITAPVGFEIKTESGSYGSSLTLVRTDGAVAATTIYVRLNSLLENTFSGDIVHTSSGALSINIPITGTVIDLSPNDPVLVQPADGAEGISLSPTLEVTASDPDSDAVDVSFYGRPVGGSGEDFTLVVLPDTQKYTPPSAYTATFSALTQWIADQASEQNIVFVTHVGDIVEDNREDGWVVADNAFDILDAGNVPYSVGVGNNDFTGTDYSLFETYFGLSRFESKSWYGGHYGSNNVDNYSLFSASGMDFILINLNFDPSTAELDWADGLLTTYSDRRAIVESHNQLNLDDSWSNSDIFNALKDHENLFLLLSGHLSNTTDGVAKRTDTGDLGQSIYSVLQDYQGYTNVNNGYLHIYRFSPADDKIYMTVYSPTLDAYNTAPDSNLEFAYEMPDVAAFDLIGTDEDVTSGSNASITWSGLVEGTEYEWFVVVDDGSTLTTGPTWSFTAGAIPNANPVLGEIGPQSINELDTLTFTATATDSDLPKQSLSFSLVGSPTGASITAGGDFSWMPIEAQGPGEYNFTVKVCDDASTPLCDEEEITVTVNEVNVAPVLAAIGDKNINELATLTLSAAATDADLPTQSLTFSLVGSPAGASITDAGDFNWIPTETQGPGEYTFIVKVCDNAGTALCDEEEITVTVDEVNVAPEITEGETTSVTMTKDGIPTSFSLILHATDSDLPGNTLTWSVSSPATNGAASASGTGESPVLDYAPDTDYIGEDSFIVQVSDGNGGTDTIIVNVTINEIDLEYALTLVQDPNTTISGTLDNLTVQFPEEISQVVVDAGYYINSRLTLGAALPEGSLVTIEREGTIVAADLTFNRNWSVLVYRITGRFISQFSTIQS